MGLAELYRLTRKPEFRTAFERIWWSIRDHDRHNNGGFSSGEQATGNPFDPRPIETCCTIAWLAMSVEMLKLQVAAYAAAPSPVLPGAAPPEAALSRAAACAADELELSTLNSVLGMHHASGRWATYNTPSDGTRFASAHQIVFQARPGSPELNCCSVNSPRGLGLIGDWAVLQNAAGVFLNYYGPGRMLLPKRRGISLELLQENALSPRAAPAPAGQPFLPARVQAAPAHPRLVGAHPHQLERRSAARTCAWKLRRPQPALAARRQPGNRVRFQPAPLAGRARVRRDDIDLSRPAAAGARPALQPPHLPRWRCTPAPDGRRRGFPALGC